MSHSSDRHKIQKRERTHRLNAKYDRHGHGGQGRNGHRGHVGRQFPQQRSVTDTSRLADATIVHDSGGPTVTNDALRDALNGRLRDAQAEHVGSAVWRNGPNGKKVRVTVINVQKAREYRERQALQGILDEIDKREGLSSAIDGANARASQASPSTPSSQGIQDVLTAARRQPDNINEIPITAQELAGEQILYEEQASTAMDDMRRHIDELHSTIARQSAMNRRNARASAKSERQGKAAQGRNGVIAAAVIGDGADDANTRKGGKAAIGGKSGNGRSGGGSQRRKGGKGNAGKPTQSAAKGNVSKRKPKRNARRLASSASVGVGGGVRGGGMPRGGAAGGTHGGTRQSQRVAARRQAIARKRMERIRQRIKFAQAVGNERLVKRLQASLDRMTKLSGTGSVF